MTIKFICTCGKHLKARDEMAARRSVCPRCGSPVGIPSLKPTHRGTTVAPLTPLERLRYAKIRPNLPEPLAPPLLARAETSPTPPPAARPVDPRLVRLLSPKGKRRPELVGRHLEKHWYESLLYPVRAGGICLALALALTVLSAIATVLLSVLLDGPPSESYEGAFFRLGCVVIPVLLVGLPCSFLDCVLASAVAGEVYYILWSGNPLFMLVRCGVKWLTCFLAGPVMFAALGYYFWLECGDPTLLDWLILTELGILTLASWAYVVLAVTDRGRWRDLNPVAVADLAHRLGWPALGVLLAAGLVLGAHGLLLFTGLEDLHTAPARGVLLLACGWASGIFCGTFFCRLLGIWCLRSQYEMAG
jgi:hypothetical protein